MKIEEKVQKFFVGTYTGSEANSKGIYTYSINKSGILERIGLAAESISPSYLVGSKDGKYLVAVNEINTNDGNGTVESYRIYNNLLEKLSSSSSGGAHPCHAAINNQGELIVSNYTGGSEGFLRLGNDGVLSDLLDVHQHSGKGTTERQEGPHAHSTWFRPDGNGIISVDLGTNELWFSNIKENEIIEQTPNRLSMKAGTGPRHLDFHPNGKYIYVMNELDNTVGLLNIHSGNRITLETSFSSLPPEFDGESKTADIHVSADGNYVYASNRGHNSIAIFKVNQSNGHLTLQRTESTRGDGPRNFKITPDNNFLIIANQHTNNIVSYAIDQKTGLLTFVSEIKAPTPVCIEFFG